jgi:signal transduction histidine kinase
MKDEANQDLSKVDSYFFSDKISIQGKKVKIDDDLKQLVTNQNGWLLILTAKGNVIGSYNAQKQLPKYIKESELASLILPNAPATVEYQYWKLDETSPQPYFLLFGRKNLETNILIDIKADVDWKNHHLNLSESSLKQIKVEEAWVQLINSDGEVVDGYGMDQHPITYSTKDLLTLPETTDDSVAAYFNAETEQTILVGIHESNSASSIEAGLFKTINNSILIIFIGLFLVLLIVTFWYARKFGVPLITMMKWIQNLGSGLYEQPLDFHQRPILLNKEGKLKRKYRLYKDLIATLSQLTVALKENEAQRHKMTQTREEWISGLSHDLKTPLASISGYAQMLETENYSWTERETKEFAGIIAEKSAYMMELLEDLTLTYRLKNQALPITKEQVDINDFIRRAIIHFINDPANNDKEFIFQPYNGKALASIDPKWFQRIIDNLIANAIKYNPSGTAITVSISPIEQHLLIITITDNGKGMDNETLEKLFQRYYRGTNTSDTSNGTGLGLTITKQLVQLHGGSINVKSAPHKGTTVRIILPI